MTEDCITKKMYLSRLTRSQDESATQPRSREGHCTVDIDSTGTPSLEIGLLLMEVFFSRMYNANLLFHKSTLFQRYLEDDLPEYLLLSIFAHAALCVPASFRQITAISAHLQWALTIP